MEGHFLTSEEIIQFEKYLKEEEKSENTIEKYIRDISAFMKHCIGAEITKEAVIAYKQSLIDSGFLLPDC